MKKVLALILCLMLFIPAAQAETVPNVTEILSAYTKLDLTPYAGKTVVINFFTEWCYFCMEEMPDLKEVNGMYNPDEFQMILVHVWDGEDASHTESVKARFGMEDMLFFEDEDRMVASVVGLRGYPATIVVKPDGELAAGINSMITTDWLTDILDGLGVGRAEAAQ